MVAIAMASGWVALCYDDVSDEANPVSLRELFSDYDYVSQLAVNRSKDDGVFYLHDDKLTRTVSHCSPQP